MFGIMSGHCGMDPTLFVDAEACEAPLFTWPQHEYDLEMLSAELSTRF